MITFSGVNHRLDSFRATMEQNGLSLLRHSVFCYLPPVRMLGSRSPEGFSVLQEDTLGGQTPYQHKGLNAKIKAGKC